METARDYEVRIAKARRKAFDRMTFGERALAGIVMFDILRRAMRHVIQCRNPNSQEQTVDEILLEQLRELRRRDPDYSDC